jgi:hypothetical protein
VCVIESNARLGHYERSSSRGWLANGRPKVARPAWYRRSKAIDYWGKKSKRHECVLTWLARFFAVISKPVFFRSSHLTRRLIEKGRGL